MDISHLAAHTEFFRGLSAVQIEYALDFFHAQRRSFQRGECFVRTGDRLSSFGLVLSGAVQVSMTDLNGNRMIMANVSTGDTFGESLSFLDVSTSPIFAAAEADCELLWLSTENLRRAPANEMDHLFMHRFAAMLAVRTLSMNDRIQILSKKTLRGKLIAFFSQQIKRRGSTSFEIALDRGAMADYLGTDRSALSRELFAMRDEGILNFHKNRFQLLHAHIFEE